VFVLSVAAQAAVPETERPRDAGSHGYEQIPRIVERSKLRVANFRADFDRRLSEFACVAGPTFSIADITTLVTVDFATNAPGTRFLPIMPRSTPGMSRSRHSRVRPRRN
jgi:hypothetical protein